MQSMPLTTASQAASELMPTANAGAVSGAVASEAMARRDRIHLNALSGVTISRSRLEAAMPTSLSARLTDLPGDRISPADIASIFGPATAFEALALLDPQADGVRAESGARLLACALAARTLDMQSSPSLFAALDVIAACGRGKADARLLPRIEALAHRHGMHAIRHAARTHRLCRGEALPLHAGSVVADVARAAADLVGYRKALAAIAGISAGPTTDSSALAAAAFAGAGLARTEPTRAERAALFHRVYAQGEAEERKAQARILSEAFSPADEMVAISTSTSATESVA